MKANDEPDGLAPISHDVPAAAADTLAVADLAFEVSGQSLPADYRHALWAALQAALPWLEGESRAGVHGIRTVEGGPGEALLARRARLTLRLPLERLAAARSLEGARLDVAGRLLAVGAAHVRALAPADTLYADFVTTGADDELAFGRDVEAALARLETPCRFICGRRRSLDAGGRTVRGYALALHGLPPGSSLRLQQEGLGGARQLGCGIFIQHKAITGIG